MLYPLDLDLSFLGPAKAIQPTPQLVSHFLKFMVLGAARVEYECTPQVVRLPVEIFVLMMAAVSRARLRKYSKWWRCTSSVYGFRIRRGSCPCTRGIRFAEAAE